MTRAHHRRLSGWEVLVGSHRYGFSFACEWCFFFLQFVNFGSTWCCLRVFSIFLGWICRLVVAVRLPSLRGFFFVLSPSVGNL